MDLDTELRTKGLVIYGRVTDGLAGNEVFIGFTSVAGAEQQGISGARVSLLEDGTVIGKYLETENGNYRLNLSGDSARTGRSYHLFVELPDGRQYSSKPSFMPGLAAIDRSGYDASVVEVVVNQRGLTDQRRLVQLIVETDIVEREKDFYLRWNIFSSYSFQERPRSQGGVPPPCYITNDISGQQAHLFNGAELKVDKIDGRQLAATAIDSRFAFDYYYTVVQSTMDAAAFAYFSLIDEVSNTRGSIFDKPAAPVPGNLRNIHDPEEEVLGYFEVIRADTTRVRIRAEDVPGFVYAPCPLRLDYSREPPECLNCLLIRNSSHHRPYFWF
ncbi:MAG: hypothetical protein Roseis2KO_54130 [Roseivirga sp.]